MYRAEALKRGENESAKTSVKTVFPLLLAPFSVDQNVTLVLCDTAPLRENYS